MHPLHRVRVEVGPSAGAITRLWAAIDTFGGCVKSADLHVLNGGGTLIEMVIDIGEATPHQLEIALHSSDAGRLHSWQDVEEAIDPVLRSLRWASSIVGLGATNDDEVVRVVGEICATSDIWLLSPADARGFEAARLSLQTGAPASLRCHRLPPSLPASFCGAGWLLAVPNGRLDPDEVVLVARPLEREFDFTEMCRVEATLALRRCAQMVASPAMVTGIPGPGPWLDVSTG